MGAFQLNMQRAASELADFHRLPVQHSIAAGVLTLYASKYSDSRFTNNFFERKLKVAATTRNFNTLPRLVELSVGEAC